jgi:hypothetical protein
MWRPLIVLGPRKNLLGGGWLCSRAYGACQQRSVLLMGTSDDACHLKLSNVPTRIETVEEGKEVDRRC